jgi:hypothetical protein
MATLPFWPSKYHFYAIENTSAIALATDLPLEEPARILLLGCGDPRNVLHTIPAVSSFTVTFKIC